MSEPTPWAEVEANRHPILRDSEEYEVVRRQFDFDSESGENTITLTLVHRKTRERHLLQFKGVSCTPPLADCIGIYILDTSYRQWDRPVRIEVGEFYEEGGVYFMAESVEEITQNNFPTT